MLYMKAFPKFMIFYFIFICLILLSAQNVNAQEEVNITIQQDENYKHRFNLEKGDTLRLNLISEYPTNFFFLSEQGLINYEINKVVKPSHENWYQLNDTFFTENLTVDACGVYFLIVENKQPPSSIYANKTLNITGIFDVKKEYIQVKEVPQYRKIIGSFMVLVLVLVFPFIIMFGRKKEKLAEISLAYLLLIFVGFIIGDISIFVGDNIQKITLLSTLITSLATLLAIAISINFVIAQVLSYTYTSAIIKPFIRNPIFIQYVVINIAIIGLLVWTLSNLEKYSGYAEVFGIILFKQIDLMIILFILAIAMIIPYIYDNVQQMRPTALINQLSKEVTLKNILYSSKIRENLKHGVKADNLNSRDNGIEFDSDGLQPLITIANKAINESNYELLRIVFDELERIGEKFTSDIKITVNRRIEIAEHFGYHLYNISKTAIIKEDVTAISSILNILFEINKSSKDDKITNETIIYLGKIGRLCASRGMANNAYDIIDFLGERGEIFSDKECEKSTNQSLNEIYGISNALIKNGLLKSRTKTIMSSFLRIVKKTVEKQSDVQIVDALHKSFSIAKSILDHGPDSPIVVGELFTFIKLLEEVGTNINNDMVTLNELLPSIIEQVEEMGTNAKEKGFTEFLIRFAGTLIVIGIYRTKQDMSKDYLLKVLYNLTTNIPEVHKEWDKIESSNLNPIDREKFNEFKSNFSKYFLI